MEGYNWTLIILATTVGFFALATILLFPVYLFLRREEDLSKGWTPEALARRQRQDAGGRRPGVPPAGPPPDAPEASGAGRTSDEEPSAA